MALAAGATEGHYREYADRASFDVSSMTISIWAYWVAASSSRRLAVRGDLGGGEWALGITGGGARFFGVNISGNRLASVAGLPSTGVWYHYVGTYNHTTGGVAFYIDGSSVATASGSATALTAGSSKVRLFEKPTATPTNKANARLAHFGFWNKVLSADEIASLYAGAHPLSISPTALVICDELDLSSTDLIGGAATTVGADVVDVDGPARLKYIARGPRRGRKTPSAGGAVNVTPSTAALTLTSYAPTVSTPRVVTPSTAALTLTTFAPTVATPVNCTPTTRALTLTTFAPTVATPVAVTPTTTALALTTYAPTVSTPVAVTPTTRALTLTAYAPTVTAGVSATPTTAALVLTGYAPTVTATASVAVTPGTAALTITTFAPTVTGDPATGGGGLPILGNRKRQRYWFYDAERDRREEPRQPRPDPRVEEERRRRARARALSLAVALAVAADDADEYGLGL